MEFRVLVPPPPVERRPDFRVFHPPTVRVRRTHVFALVARAVRRARAECVGLSAVVVWCARVVALQSPPLSRSVANANDSIHSQHMLIA